MLDVLIEGLDVDQDVFDTDRRNVKYEEIGNDSYYSFSKTIMQQQIDVHFEIYDQQRCYVAFTVNDSYVKEKKSDYDVMLALRVMSYVVSCMKSVKDIHNTIEQFEFTADKQHEIQYDKLLPRLSRKLGFEYTKEPWTYQRTLRDKVEKTVKLTAFYTIKVD